MFEHFRNVRSVQISCHPYLVCGLSGDTFPLQSTAIGECMLVPPSGGVLVNQLLESREHTGLELVLVKL